MSVCIFSGVCIVVLLHPQVVYSSAHRDSLKSNHRNIYFYPYAFYTPETHYALGTAVISYFRSGGEQKIRPSKMALSGYYSTRKQYYLSLTPELYFKDEKYLVSAKFNFGKYADKFWGIGNDTPEIGNEDYILMLVGFRASIQTRIYGDIKAGLVLEAKKAMVPDKRDNPFLITGNIRGSDGGNSVGSGIVLSYDSRDNIFFPSRGIFTTINFVSFGPLTGSDFDFKRTIADLRGFFNLRGNHIFALQGYGNFTGGNPPFYELPALGGQNSLRGYFLGRYRDRNYLMTQLEYRTILFWKIGVAGFAGVGDVYGHLSDLSLNKIKYSLGGGLRFVIDVREKLDVRLDLGWGKNSSGVYFAIEEAF